MILQVPLKKRVVGMHALLPETFNLHIETQGHIITVMTTGKIYLSVG